MHPPNAPIVYAPLERKMNGGGARYRADARHDRRLSTSPEILLPNAMRAPDVISSSAQTGLERRAPDPARPILDPRDGDAEDDASSPKQKSLLAIAGSLLAEISLPKLALAWIASIVLPAAILGVAPLIVTAWVGDVFVRVRRIDRNWRRAGAARRGACRLVRLAPLVSRGREELLGAQRARGPAGIRALPRGDPPSRGAGAETERRSGARAHARLKLRRRRNAACRRRGAHRLRRLAVDAMDRIGP